MCQPFPEMSLVFTNHIKFVITLVASHNKLNQSQLARLYMQWHFCISCNLQKIKSQKTYELAYMYYTNINLAEILLLSNGFFGI